MSQIKTNINLFLFALVLYCFPSMAFEITDTTSTSSEASDSTSAEKHEKQITCAMKAAGAKNPKQMERVKYVAKALGTVFSQMSPELKSQFIRHLLAQGSAETDNLRLIEEKKSKYASSKSKWKGRGLSQTTHKDNYAKLAGCEKVTEKNPHPSKIKQTEMAKAPKITGSDIVKNPASTVSEKNERGKKLLALGALCYFLDTKARHPKFAKALEGTSDSDVNIVGVALNRGPGAIGKGKKPLGAKKRLAAFKSMGSCFSTGGLEI